MDEVISRMENGWRGTGQTLIRMQSLLDAIVFIKPGIRRVAALPTKETRRRGGRETELYHGFAD